MRRDVRQPLTKAPLAPMDIAAAAATWTDILGFWAGCRLPADARPLSMMTGASAVTQQALQTCQTMLEANRMTANAVYDAARHQQEQAFAAASAALATFAAFPGDEARQAVKESWKQVVVTSAEACGRSLGAAWALAGTMLEMKRQATADKAAA